MENQTRREIARIIPEQVVESVAVPRQLLLAAYPEPLGGAADDPPGSSLFDHDPLDGRRSDDRFDSRSVGELLQQAWELVGVERSGAPTCINSAQTCHDGGWDRTDKGVEVGEAPHLPTFRQTC